MGGITYENYYEIYIQEIYEGKIKYCLTETKKKLVGDEPSENKYLGIPQIDFTDVDRDGMVDMMFYHDKHIYTYYNTHKHVDYNGGYDQKFLCKKWNQTQKGPIFSEYKDALIDIGYAAGGNENLTIQSLEVLNKSDQITDIAKTLPMSKVTGRIRHTDLNIDGYPDIFITLECRFKNSSYSSHYKKSLTLINVPCDDEHPCPNGAERTRYFVHQDP